MKASEVMVSNVITVGPDARVPEVAELLLHNRISAVPVVGADVTERENVERADRILRGSRH